ncbi:MAG TPA: UbiA family prenyltransferase [Gemmatimonadales bacterium]|nr:UbiA family prenyltransferase [Gemmatimonadales bacterium]
MLDLLRLVRFHNLLVAAAAVLAGGWIALGAVVTPGVLALAAVAAVGFGAAGNALNDEWDRAADRINRPGGERPLAAGRLSRGAADLCIAAGTLVGFAAAALVSGTAVLVGGAALVVLAVYSPVLKSRGPVGNLAVALVAGLPLEYGALAVGHAAAGLVPWILASWIHLVREVVKDVDDQAGDHALGRRTLPLVLGERRAMVIAAVLAAAFVPLSLGLPAWAHYGGAYFLIALFAQLIVLAVASRLFTGRTHGNSLLLKGAMLVGIVALVAGRVT